MISRCCKTKKVEMNGGYYYCLKCYRPCDMILKRSDSAWREKSDKRTQFESINESKDKISVCKLFSGRI